MDRVLREGIDDLYNELRWLLCAATQWAACHRLSGVPGFKEPCHHIKLYAMDSALLHARSLYEFFTATESAINRNQQNGIMRLTWRDYSQTGRQTSTKYNQFMKPLHGRVMHLDKDRSGYEEVKNEVVGLAKDVLTLWKAFSAKLAADPSLKPYVDLLHSAENDAIEEARRVAKQYNEFGFQFPFS
jgi:hypothetical protein